MEKSRAERMEEQIRRLTQRVHALEQRVKELEPEETVPEPVRTARGNQYPPVSLACLIQDLKTEVESETTPFGIPETPSTGDCGDEDD
jgi:hypothetical protein